MNAPEIKQKKKRKKEKKNESLSRFTRWLICSKYYVRLFINLIIGYNLKLKTDIHKTDQMWLAFPMEFKSLV